MKVSDMNCCAEDPHLRTKIELVVARHKPAMNTIIEQAESYAAETRKQIDSISDPVLRQSVLDELKSHI
jgi:hypothetical protein